MNKRIVSVFLILTMVFSTVFVPGNVTSIAKASVEKTTIEMQKQTAWKAAEKIASTDELVQVHCESLRTYFLFENGELYEYSSSKMEKTMDNVRYYMGNSSNQFIITKEDELYGWGKNNQGILGQDASITQVKEPVFMLANVDKIVVTGKVVLAITKDKELYLWGMEDNGSAKSLTQVLLF